MVGVCTRRDVLLGALTGIGGMATGGLGFAQAQGYRAVMPQNGARLRGALSYQGIPIELLEVSVTKDPEICGPDPRLREAVRISDAGALADCVIQIKGITEGKPWPALYDEAKIFQVDCGFQPYVQIVQHDATLYVINLDPILHNIHAYEVIGKARRTLFNFSQPSAGEEDYVPLKLRRGHLVTVDCNVHNWMASWIYTSESPYLAMTDENGAFEIGDIPPGEYEFSAWHPVLGEKAGKIAFNPGDDLQFDLIWT